MTRSIPAAHIEYLARVLGEGCTGTETTMS